MNPSLRFRGRHALHAVRSGFKLEPAVHLLARDERDDFLVSAGIGIALAHDFHFPAHFFRVAAVHAEEIRREQRGFFPSGAGADFEKDVLFIQRVGGQKQHLQFMLKLGEFFFQRLDVFGGHFPDIGIGIAGEFPVVREVLPQRLVLTKDVHDGLEIRMGLCQLAIALLVVENIGFRKFMLKFHELPFQRFELGKHNFSGVTGIDGAMREGTRPARHAVRKKRPGAASSDGGAFRGQALRQAPPRRLQAVPCRVPTS